MCVCERIFWIKMDYFLIRSNVCVCVCVCVCYRGSWTRWRPSCQGDRKSVNTPTDTCWNSAASSRKMSQRWGESPCVCYSKFACIFGFEAHILSVCVSAYVSVCLSVSTCILSHCHTHTHTQRGHIKHLKSYQNKPWPPAPQKAFCLLTNMLGHWCI